MMNQTLLLLIKGRQLLSLLSALKLLLICRSFVLYSGEDKFRQKLNILGKHREPQKLSPTFICSTILSALVSVSSSSFALLCVFATGACAVSCFVTLLT